MSAPIPTQLVSIITPTKNREVFMPRIAACVQAQTVAWEWLVCDDSAEPSAFLTELAARDARVKYLHTTEGLTIGAKRNRLIEMAQGEVIAHFDDDDYYSPHYLQRMVTLMNEQAADLIKLSGFYMIAPGSGFFGYLDLNAKVGLHYALVGNSIDYMNFHEKWYLGEDLIVFYGFSFVFRKSAWQTAPFRDISLSDDEHFAKTLLEQGRKIIAVDDPQCDCLHTVHPQSTARCLSGYRLPMFLLPRLFPDPLAQQWPPGIAELPLSPFLGGAG